MPPVEMVGPFLEGVEYIVFRRMTAPPGHLLMPDVLIQQRVVVWPFQRQYEERGEELRYPLVELWFFVFPELPEPDGKHHGQFVLLFELFPEVGAILIQFP